MAEFELSPELIDQIVYAMENQKDDFFLDTKTLDILPENPDEDNTDIISLPSWNSSDGFLLMEKFTGTLHNPIYREELRQTLAGGKGVFRNFKITVKKHCELERMWFVFKEKEMKLRVADWYNEWREIQGLEKIQVEFGETEELILSDFNIIFGSGGYDKQILELDRIGFYEIFNEYPRKLADYFYSLRRKPEDLAEPVPHLLFTAESPSEELAAFVWCRKLDFDPQPEDKLKRPSTAFDVMQLYVIPEYRGLGIASLLVEKAADYAYSQEADWLFASLYSSSAGFAGSLSSRGFSEKGFIYQLDIKNWGETRK